MGKLISTILLLISTLSWGIELKGQPKEMYEELNRLSTIINRRDSTITIKTVEANNLRKERAQQDGQIRRLKAALTATRAQLVWHRELSERKTDTIQQQERIIINHLDTIYVWEERYISLDSVRVAVEADNSSKKDTIVLLETLVDTFSNLVTSQSCRIYGIYKPHWFSFKKSKRLKIDPVGETYLERASKIKELEFSVSVVRPEISPDKDKNLHILFGPRNPDDGQLVEIIEPQPLKRYRQKVQGGWITYLFSPPAMKLKRGQRRLKGDRSADQRSTKKGKENKKKKKKNRRGNRRYAGTKLKRNTFYQFKIYIGDDPNDRDNILANGQFKTR